MPTIERCAMCQEPTGKAGRGEDSLYCTVCDEGPHCERCDDAHRCKCGLCGERGADKVPHPVHWPGEAVPDFPIVHAECEAEECKRAHRALTDGQRRDFLRTL